MKWPGSTRPQVCRQGCERGPSPHSPAHEPQALSFPGLADGTLPSFSMSMASSLSRREGAHHTAFWVTSVLI